VEEEDESRSETAMSYMSGHAGSGSALYFRSAAASDVRGMRMETKYCEGCTRMYVRPVNPEARLGRDCDRCVRAADERRAKEAAELKVARELGDPKKMMPAVKRRGHLEM